MPDTAILENTDIGSTAADISQDNTNLLLILGQNRFRRRQGFKSQPPERHSSMVDRLFDGFGVGSVGVEHVSRCVETRRIPELVLYMNELFSMYESIIP